MTELKPCPFCGAAASAWEWNGGARVDCSKWGADAYSVYTHYVGIGARTMEEAIELWNRRAELPSAQPEKRTDKRTETHACDVISRQEAIDIVRRAKDKSEAHRMLVQMPSVDAVPVVRCKDCVHLSQVAGSASTGEGIYKCDVWKAHTANGDCFCSYGQRKEQQ